MTCKDCICFERCKQLADKGVIYLFSGLDGAEKNECFKDKSRFIKLPCKAGDTVYCILFSPKYDKLIVAEGFVKSFKIDETIKALKETVFVNNVFLDREEAEKALKEIEK